MSSKDYSNLQASIDRVIGKIGLEKTVFLLESFVDNAALCTASDTRIKLITQYLFDTACDVFALDKALFCKSQVREYRDARMCCIHLLRKYTEDSFAKIGESLHTIDRIAMYGFHRAAERLEYPKGNAVFVGHYNDIESRLIVFMSKLN